MCLKEFVKLKNNAGRDEPKRGSREDVTPPHSEILDFQLTNFGVTINNT